LCQDEDLDISPIEIDEELMIDDDDDDISDDEDDDHEDVWHLMFLHFLWLKFSHLSVYHL